MYKWNEHTVKVQFLWSDFTSNSRQKDGSRRFNKVKESLMSSTEVCAFICQNKEKKKIKVTERNPSLTCCLCVCPSAAIHRGDLRQLERKDLPEVHWEVRQRRLEVRGTGWRSFATINSHLIYSFFPFSDKFTRFCQWKNVELNIHVSTSFPDSPFTALVWFHWFSPRLHTPTLPRNNIFIVRVPGV